MAGMRICVNTQTPIVRFKLGYSQLMEKYGITSRSVKLSRLEEGVDYDYTPGGVTRMVYPLLLRMRESGLVSDPKWISLGPGAPRQVKMSGLTLYNISLDQTDLAAYTNFKEGIWNEIHGLGALTFRPNEYASYVYYNWLSARLMLDMLGDTDLFWIHDFQQLHVGNTIGPSAPAVLRWHIPLKLEGVSARLRALILKSIEGFDAMIVSTRRDLEGLIHAGYRGRATAIYPYLDPRTWNRVGKGDVEALRSKFRLKTSDKLLTVVARMDPVKSQDVAIRAMGHLRRRFPDLKLVLAGNGSFTGSVRGGLGHPKAKKWRAHLESVVRELKLRDRVVFTGHITNQELDALYQTSEVVAVPSNIEGFNLTAVEGWLHSRPCVVSDGAGVSELVHEGLDGHIFRAGDDSEMAAKLEGLLRSPEAASKMGENGLTTSNACHVDNAMKSVAEVFENALKLYPRRHGTKKSRDAPL